MKYFAGDAASNFSSYNKMEKSFHQLKKADENNSTPAQRRALNFAIAARAGSGLRKGLKELLPNSSDRNMQNRFQRAIANWLGVSVISELAACDEAPFINTFEFTKGREFKAFCKVPITVAQFQENLIAVSIDAFIPRSAITAPADTVSVELVLTVAGCMLQGGTPTGNKTINIVIPYNKLTQRAQVIKFPIHTPAGSLTVTAARLIYHDKKNSLSTKINDAAFIAAGVLNARYSF
ncbi:MAG: hypothetical protein M3139_13920 [Bacteroidota bacterium]|nr:hypothetical protein [Bacteroidota bacterium]